MNLEFMFTSFHTMIQNCGLVESTKLRLINVVGGGQSHYYVHCAKFSHMDKGECSAGLEKSSPLLMVAFSL